MAGVENTGHHATGMRVFDGVAGDAPARVRATVHRTAATGAAATAST